MSRLTRPRAPWHSPATRRLALVRIGLPTLVACVLATGPGAAAQAGHMVPPRAAALMSQVTTVLHPPPPPPVVEDRPAGADDPGRGAPAGIVQDFEGPGQRGPRGR